VISFGAYRIVDVSNELDTSEARADRNRRESGWLRLLPLVAVAVATGPLLLWGLPAGHDWGWELVRLVEYKEAFATGQVLPFWALDLYSGWGSPIFLFYAPLFSALASAGSALFGSLFTGPTIALIALTMVSAFLVTRMMGAVPGEGSDHKGAAARIAAYVYVLQPYLLADLLIRSANAEYTALCLIPLVFYGVFRLRQSPRWGALALAVGLGLSILAHNLTALIAMGLALLSTAVLYVPSRSKRQLAAAAGGVGLGLLLTSWFWVPALALTHLVRPGLLVEGRYDFHENFLDFASLWGHGEYFSAGWLSPVILVLALALAGSSRLKLSGSYRRLFWCLLSCAAAAVVLQMAISRPVWEVTPLLPLFQFPWRLMGPLAALTAMLAGLLVLGLTTGLGRRQVLVVELLMLALCIANAVPQLTRVRSFSPEGVASIEQSLTAAGIRQGRQSATGVDEYLPALADIDAWKETPPGSLLLDPPSGLEVLAVEQEGTLIRLDLNSPEATNVRLARWYFPRWRASLNGEPLVVEPGSLGEISMAIPDGRSQLEVHLEPPLARRAFVWVSGLAMVVFLLASAASFLPWFEPHSSS
jgi:uncharacterized membrane protein